MLSQSATLRVTATRPFRMPEYDEQKAITGQKVVKTGESITVDRFLASELISSGKAEPAAAKSDPAPAPFRSNRNPKE